jgi:hypothetical protein
MNAILNLGISPILIGSLLILFGVLIERWLVINGFVRNKTNSVIIIAICSVLIRQIWFISMSWWYFVPFIILAMIFGVNRGDLWTTMNRGRWWWKANSNNNM